MLFQLTDWARAPRSGYASLLGVLVVMGLLASCGESNQTEANDEGPSSTRDGGEPGESAKPVAPKPAGTAVAPTPRPAVVGLPQSGRPAPELSLTDVETKQPWSLAEQVDPTGESCPKGVLVAFMASWCQYCSSSLPTLVELEKANPELAVVTVTVDTTDDARKAELEKVRKAGLTGPVLAADEKTVAAWVGGSKSVPKYYFINHNGLITAKDDGFGDNVAPKMPAQVTRALAN